MVNLYHVFCSSLVLAAISDMHIVIVKLNTRKNLINSNPSIPRFIRQPEYFTVLTQFIFGFLCGTI